MNLVFKSETIIGRRSVSKNKRKNKKYNRSKVKKELYNELNEVDKTFYNSYDHDDYYDYGPSIFEIKWGGFLLFLSRLKIKAAALLEKEWYW